jgi:hypothetical protein
MNIHKKISKFILKNSPNILFVEYKDEYGNKETLSYDPCSLFLIHNPWPYPKELLKESQLKLKESSKWCKKMHTMLNKARKLRGQKEIKIVWGKT